MYVSMSLRSFALSLVGIFVPIYLYTLGYSIRNIFLFYLMANAFQFFGDFFTGYAIAKFGAKKMLALSYPVVALNITILATMSAFHWPLWFPALTLALAQNLFWTPYHDDFSKAKSKKSTGKEVGNWIILSELFGALGPLIGGIVAQAYGVQYGLIAALIIIICAVFPLLGKREIVKKRPIHHSFSAFKKSYKDLIAYGGLSLEGMTLGIIWPLFLFLFIKSYAKVGFIVTFSLLVVVALSILMGKLTDKYKKEKVMRAGSLAGFLTATTRTLATGVGTAYVVSTVSSLSQIFLYIPFFSVYYLHADKSPRTEYISMMEMSVDVFRGVLYAVLFLATFFLPDKSVFLIAFGFAAIGSLSTMLIAGSGKQKTKKIKVHKEIAKAGT